MATEVNIANLALAHLGEKAVITSLVPPSGGVHANTMATFYPMARDFVLEDHLWGFATKRVSLSQLGTPPDEWEYSYAYPNDCLLPSRLYEDGVPFLPDDPSDPFKVEVDSAGTRLIYSNTSPAKLIYGSKVTNTVRFTTKAVTAISFYLAYLASGTIRRGDKRIKAEMLQAYTVAIGSAQAHDANSDRSKELTPPTQEPAHLKAR